MTLPCLLTLKKRIQAFETKCLGKLLSISYEEHETMTVFGARSTSSWVYKKLVWQLSRRRKLAWFGHVTRHDSLSRTILQGTFEVGDTVVGRENAGWTTSKSGYPCPRQNCSRGPSAEKTGRGSLLNHPSCPPDDPIGQGTETN